MMPRLPTLAPSTQESRNADKNITNVIPSQCRSGAYPGRRVMLRDSRRNHSLWERGVARPRKDAVAGKRNTADAILEAAERLCVTHGIEAMSIRDVAAAVGVTVPVIYHHFGSRANLIRALV